MLSKLTTERLNDILNERMPETLEYDEEHTYVQKVCEHIHVFTRSGLLNWNLIYGTVTINILDKEKQIAEIDIDPDYKTRSIVSLENNNERYFQVGPAFYASVNNRLIFLTCTTDSDTETGPLYINVHFSDWTGHDIDFLESYGPFNNINLAYAAKNLRDLYFVLCTYYEIPINTNIKIT